MALELGVLVALEEDQGSISSNYMTPAPVDLTPSAACLGIACM